MVRPPIEETRHLVQLLVVVLAVDEARAGRRAKVEVVVKAGASERELRVFAAAIGDDTPNGFERRPQGDRVRVRSPVPGAVVRRPADQGDSREVLVQGQFDVQVVLVIPEPDVEPGTMALDHGLLEHQGFLLRRRGDHFELVDARDHGSDVLGQDAGSLEIVRHPVAQAERLAGVNHPALSVTHEVDARRLRQRLQSFSKIFRPLRDGSRLLGRGRHVLRLSRAPGRGHA